jgi:hypothetical protein
VIRSARFSFVPSCANISYYGFGLVGHSTGSYVPGDSVTPQNSRLGCCTNDPLSLRFKHESFGLDIKPLAKLPLPLSS